MLIARAVRGWFLPTRDLWRWARIGERVGCVPSHVVSMWSRSPGCSGFRRLFWMRRDFVFFFSRFLSWNGHGKLQVWGRLASFTHVLMYVITGTWYIFDRSITYTPRNTRERGISPSLSRRVLRYIYFTISSISQLKFFFKYEYHFNVI